MKYGVTNKSKIFHIRDSELTYNPHAICSYQVWFFGDKLYDSKPHGYRICKRCHKKLLETMTEEEIKETLFIDSL